MNRPPAPPGPPLPLTTQIELHREVLALAPLRGPLQPLPVRAAYDDPCHLLHGQQIREQPRVLLRQVPDLQLLEVPESDWCCGSAGTYNMSHADTANALLDRKMAHLAALQPQLIVTGNPGCILQLRQGVARHQPSARVVHPMEVIARPMPGGRPQQPCCHRFAPACLYRRKRHDL